MKIKRYIKRICYLIIFTLFISFNIGATNVSIPNQVKVNTDKEELYRVRYGDEFYMKVKKLNLEELPEVTYCLDINKDYPSGQKFAIQSNKNLIGIDNILAEGYPNKTASQLNLSNDNEAYFATQIALWTFIEKYDVNKITGDNPQIIEAIKNIYNNGIAGKSPKTKENIVYKTDSEDVQSVISIFDPNNLSLTEDQAELLQVEYPNQEG